MKLSEQLLAMMPKKKESLNGIHELNQNCVIAGYNQALADVKAILEKVEVDEDKLSDVVWNNTSYRVALNDACDIASAIAKDLPIKE